MKPIHRRRPSAPPRRAPLRLAVASLLALPLAACQDPGGTTLADESLRELEADQVLYDMSTYVTTAGVRQAEVRADTAYMFRDSSVAHLVAVDMTVFDEAGGERAAVTADRGRLERRSETLNAWGNVVLRIPGQNRVIESSELNYDPSSDRIWSDSATTMREGSRVTRGTCFNSDLQFRNYTVCRPTGAVSGVGVPGAGPGGGG